MKTLNGVITELEKIVENPTDGALESEGYYLAQDSLYYLKKYQNKLINFDVMEQQTDFNKKNLIKGIQYAKNM